MNCMKQVAKMLGVEIDEEFSILETGLIYKFVDNGLLQKHSPIATWHGDDHMLRCLLSGEYEIVKKPILEVAEIEYLSAVIKPFRDMVTSVNKFDSGKYEYIAIKYRSIEEYIGTVRLPSFKKDTMYKGMEVNKHYSLEELGL